MEYFKKIVLLTCLLTNYLTVISFTKIEKLDPIFIKIEIVNANTKRPAFNVETNLPDNTEMMISLEGKNTNFIGQDKQSVKNSRFQAGPFGPQVGLKNGLYTLSIITPYPFVQPKSVQSIIGAKGENLKGPLVVKEKLGSMIRFKKSVVISEKGTNWTEDNTNIDIEMKNKAIGILKELVDLENKGRNMESLRSSTNPSDKSKCMELMKEYTKRCNEIESKLNTLPKKYSFVLKKIIIELKSCVLCTSIAIESCDRAKQSIKEAEISIGK